MERFYAHDGPHVINKICGLNRTSFKNHGGFQKTYIMDAPHEETTDVSSRFLCENRKPLDGKADGKPGRGNGLIEAAIEILRTLSTVVKGRLASSRPQRTASRAPYGLKAPQDQRECANGDGKRTDQQANEEQPVTGCRAGCWLAGIAA